MNAVCMVFYEQVVRTLPSYKNVKECAALSGLIGLVARKCLDNEACFVMKSNNGQIQKKHLIYFYKSGRGGSRVDMEQTTKKYLSRSLVDIFDTPQEGPEEVQSTCYKLPEIVNSTNVSVALESSLIGKRSEKLVESIKYVSSLFIDAPITDGMNKILEIMVQKKTLTQITIHCHHEFNEFSKKIVLDLLKQDQFYIASLFKNCRLFLGGLIAEWKQNSHLMVGKEVAIRAKWGHQFCSQFGLQACTDDEYLILSNHLHIDPADHPRPFILRGQNGRALFACAYSSGDNSSQRILSTATSACKFVFL